jgi:sugar phosphate permease
MFGAVVALSMSGILSNTKVGWHLVFYASSALGLFSAGIWLSLAADSPSQHPLASPRERRYIAETINVNTGATNHNTNEVINNRICSIMCILL